MKAQQGQFVILKHTRHDQLPHWDFMFEQDDYLLTFRCDIDPESPDFESALLTRIFDHDKKFITYRGPVNNGLGFVSPITNGTFRIVTRTESGWIIQIETPLFARLFSLEKSSDTLWHLASFK